MGDSEGAAGLTLGVCIPTLNEAECIGPMLDRLLDASQATDRADQVVVVDGGSLDNTCAQVEERLAKASSEERAGQGLKLCHSEPGRGVQLALGGAQLSTDLVLFLHADCLPDTGALAEIKQAFGDPELMSAGLRQHIDAPGWLFRSIAGAANLRVRWGGIVYGDSALVLRRSLYEELGGFRAVPLFEDLDLARRVRRRARPRFLGRARVLVSARRWEREGTWKRTLGNWVLTVRYLCGVSPERLAKSYAPQRPNSSSGSQAMEQRP